jgi:hypothetical protein
MRSAVDHKTGRSEQILRGWSLKIQPEQVLRAQGVDPDLPRPRSPVLAELVEQALTLGPALVDPVVLTRRLGVTGLRHERLLLEGGFELNGPLIPQHMAPATRVRVLICTLGPELEARVAFEMGRNPPLGMALDAYGSAAIQELATMACGYFEAEAKSEGLGTTIPLSPGMIGWPLDQGQLELFALVDATQIGVTLTTGLQMIPRKSLSMVVGLGSDMERSGRACDYCSMQETCRYQDHYA